MVSRSETVITCQSLMEGEAIEGEAMAGSQDSRAKRDLIMSSSSASYSRQDCLSKLLVKTVKHRD